MIPFIGNYMNIARRSFWTEPAARLDRQKAAIIYL